MTENIENKLVFALRAQGLGARLIKWSEEKPFATCFKVLNVFAQKQDKQEDYLIIAQDILTQEYVRFYCPTALRTQLFAAQRLESGQYLIMYFNGAKPHPQKQNVSFYSFYTHIITHEDIENIENGNFKIKFQNSD